MAELIWRLRGGSGPRAAAGSGELWWALGVGGATALALAFALTLSIQAACALVLVLVVIALYWHNRQWGITALFAFWFLAPMIRRWLGLKTGYIGNDPLSLAPFLATAALAGFELMRVHVPREIRRVLLLAAAGFAIGLPIGLVNGPRAALYAFVAYLTGGGGRRPGVEGGPGGEGQHAAARPALRHAGDRRVRDPAARAAAPVVGPGLAAIDRLRQRRRSQPRAGAGLRLAERPWRAGPPAGAFAALLPHDPPGPADRDRRRRPHRRRPVGDLRALGLGGAPARGGRPRRGVERPQRPRRVRGRRGHGRHVARPLTGELDGSRRDRSLQVDHEPRGHLHDGALGHRERNAAKRRHAPRSATVSAAPERPRG